MTSRSRVLAVSVALTATASAPAFAQADSTVRFDEAWRPLLGCWAPANDAASPVSFCVVPTRDRQTVEVVSVLGDSIVSRSPLSATGARVARAQDGCSGFETGTWSADERRLFTHADYTCAGGQKVSSDGLFTLVTPTRFTRIEAVPVAGGSTVRVRGYVLRTDMARMPSSIASRLPSPTADRAVAARRNAAGEVTPAAVAEAATLVESSVVDTWLAMRGQLFGLTAAETRALRRSHVAEGTITAMVSGYRPSGTEAVGKAADFGPLNNAQANMGSGLSMGDSDRAFNDYVPYWLYKMGVGTSYDSSRANTPCNGSVACSGLYNYSTGEFFVKHPPIRSSPSAPTTITDNASASSGVMSMPSVSPASSSINVGAAPTITGKP